MERLRKIMEHPNFQRIKESVEFKCLKKEALLMLGILGVLLLLVLLLVCSVGSTNLRPKSAMQLFMLIMVLIGAFCYYTYRFWELFGHIDRYTFSNALLNEPHQGYKGSMFFTVEVRNRQGKMIKKDTRNIFSKGEPNFEDYLNQQVLVGYNDKTDIVVVIKKLT